MVPVSPQPCVVTLETAVPSYSISWIWLQFFHHLDESASLCLPRDTTNHLVPPSSEIWVQHHRDLPPSSEVSVPVGKCPLFRSLRFSSRDPVSQVLVIQPLLSPCPLPPALLPKGNSCFLQFLPLWNLREALSNKNIMWILVFTSLVATFKKSKKKWWN